jgi:D-alanyl-D-alanine carboxypeptidase (penicillin-binding protein 5/6)
MRGQGFKDSSDPLNPGILEPSWPTKREKNLKLPRQIERATLLRKILFHSVAIFSFLNCAGTVLAADPFPRVASSYLVIVNGAEIWAHRPDLPLAPASLTKIMTTLLVLEKAGVEDVVTVPRKASRETGTRLRLQPGDKFYVIDLLAATLLRSANDACHALAAHVSGSEASFVNLMNARARELGLANTHFTNACGHDHPKHYSTAHDLAALAEVALKNPIFAKMVSLVMAEIRTMDGEKTFTVENKNQLIGRYPGAVGVKTGFTRSAGKCLIALAERDSSQSLLVLLNAPDRWWTATRMLDAAFAETPRKTSGP